MKSIEVVAAVIRHEGKFLCMQKGVTKYAYTSHKFEFPGGKIEPGETPQQALKREIREEMDMDIKVGVELLTVYHQYPDFALNLKAFLCQATSIDFHLKEHASFQWVEREQLMELDWSPADVSIVKAICGMTAQKLSSETAHDEQVRALYETAFPVEEQIPYEDLMLLMDKMPLDFTAYYDDGEFIGFTIVYPRKTFNWFWYFAVRSEFRGKGHGQRILTMLMEEYKDCTNILDMESPDQVCENSEQRNRRCAFYLRNGFRKTGILKSFEGIEYTILMNGEGTFTLQDYEEVLDELRSFWKGMPEEEL